MNKNVKRLLALTMAFIMVFAAGIPVLANQNSTPAANQKVPLEVVGRPGHDDAKLSFKFKVSPKAVNSLALLTTEFKSDVTALKESDPIVIKRIDGNGNTEFSFEVPLADIVTEEGDGENKKISVQDLYLAVYNNDNRQARYYKIFAQKDENDKVILENGNPVFDSEQLDNKGEKSSDAFPYLTNEVYLDPRTTVEEVFVPGPIEFCLRWSYNDPNVGQDKYVLSTNLKGKIFYVNRGQDPTPDANRNYVDHETGQKILNNADAKFISADTAGKLCFKGKVLAGKDYYVEWTVNKDLFVEGKEGGITGIFYVSENNNGKHVLKGLKSDGKGKPFLLDDSRTWEIDAVSTETNILDLGFDIPLTPVKPHEYKIKAIGSENQPVRGVRFDIFILDGTDVFNYAKDQDGNYIVKEPAFYRTEPTNRNGYTGISAEDFRVDTQKGTVYIKSNINTGSPHAQWVELRTGEKLGIRAVKEGFPGDINQDVANIRTKAFSDDCYDCEYEGYGNTGYKFNSKVYLFDMWKNLKPDRFNEATKDPSVNLKEVFELRNDKVLTTVPFMDLFATIRVKIFNAGATTDVREPITGAKVALYENGNSMVGEELKAGKLLKEKKTDKYGIAEFRNVPISQIKQFFNIDGPYCTDQYEGEEEEQKAVRNFDCDLYSYDKGAYRTAYMPYLIKQLDTGNHEGVAPYPYFISTSGYFEYENDSTRTDKGLTIKRSNYGHVFDIEIENHVDFFGMYGRIAGENRYETSVEIAKAQFPDGPPLWNTYGEPIKNRYVVLAEVDTFADALTAGVIAYEYRAPLLMVKGDKLPESVANYMTEVGATKAIIVGGPGTISREVENEVQGLLGGNKPQRIQGENRFGTAVQAGEALRKLIKANDADKPFLKGYRTSSTVFLANAYTFADALTASVPASYYGIPILLTYKDKLPVETMNAINDWNINNVIVVGGENSVSDKVLEEISEKVVGTVTFDRFSGANRQLTSMTIAERIFSFSDVSRVFFANKTSFADALAAAPYAAKVQAPIILVDKDFVSDDVRDFLTRNNMGEGTIFGGYNQVSTQVRDELAKILNLRSQYPGIE